MRIDKWLSSVNVIKRRTIATDMVKNGVVFVNEIEAKPSKNISIGDKIKIKYLTEEKNYEVLNIPATKTIPKSQKELYVKEL
ncbi:MAG: RNA-binding S4 domain-containing protein [Epsilonproteobacteria bacterium]|nr:RNA-binding S4 domain-containing protein [Campylobacterota bacterium]